VKNGTTEQRTMATKDAAAWFNERKDATIADRRKKRRKKEKNRLMLSTDEYQKQR
jgi:hypothetical protein